MADFRKWLLAFAVVALFLGLGTTASAQTVSNSSFSCTANAGQPPIVRAEGVTELVGDVVLNCTGGIPTALGQTIPTVNFQIFLNTLVTSREYAGNVSEALLLIDDPYPTDPVPAGTSPSSNAAPTQVGCVASGPGTGTNACGPLSGVGPAGTGGATGPVGATGPYNGTTDGVYGTPRYNILQGIYSTQQSALGQNSIAWLGVPIDSPGTNSVGQQNTRTIRITNVRANACNLGVSSTLIPTQIVMLISVNGAFPINNPQQIVGYIQHGLVASNGTGTFTQCDNLNAGLLGGTGGDAGSAVALVTEGFASSFKPRTYAQYFTSTGAAVSPSAPVASGAAATLQNVPNFTYNAESGFVTDAPGLIDDGSGYGAVGVADTGTELTVNLAAIGNGVSVFLPNTIYLYPSTQVSASGGPSGNPTGVAQLIGSGGGSGSTSVSISSNAGTATYEVLLSAPSVIETAYVVATPAFISDVGATPSTPTNGTSTFSSGFAPQAGTAQTASTSAPIPRFCPSTGSNNLFTINACSCNLLFPFVTNQAGFDTGIAIANSTVDPFGTVPEQGTVTMNWYGSTVGGGAAPPAFTTTDNIAAGAEFVFTLSNGGTDGFTGAPGFQGYMIATANFRYCHGFAFISDLGAQKLAEGYLAIQLDIPGLNRTGILGENEGH